MQIRSPRGGSRVAPRAAYEQMKLESRRQCPSAVFAIIEEWDNNILFEFHHQGCQREPAAHYVMRVFSDEGIYAHLFYARKTERLAPDVREAWIRNLKHARPMQGGSS